jgi:transcriptional regulator with XRE-family HTH domain
MPHQVPPPLSLALTHLRLASGWTQQELARAAGAYPGLICDYERGTRKTLSMETLQELLSLMGYEPADVTTALLFQAALSGAEAGGLSLVEPSIREVRRANRIAVQAGLTEANNVRSRLLDFARSRRAVRARRAAAELWWRLQRRTKAGQIDAVERSADFHSWALAERLCDESIRAAADSAEETRHLAELALRVAELISGQGTGHLHLRAYCRAFVANAERIAGDLTAANASFATAWILWREAAPTASGPLGEWRLHDLEASLRRDQRDFAAARMCIDRACASAPPEALGRILLNKVSVLEQAGEIHQALESLEQAAPLLDAGREPRLVWGLEVNRIVMLCHLGRFAEAEERLPAVRRRAVALGAELDLARVLWLTGRVAAARGRREEARAAFEQVRRAFVQRAIGLDAALVSLDLAIFHLEDGRTAEVALLARETLAIFNALRIPREALASLRLFTRAAQTGTATAAMARHAMGRLERARHEPKPHFKDRGDVPRAERRR